MSNWKSGESELMKSQTESLMRIADTLEHMLGIGKGYIEGRGYKPPIITNADRIRAMTDEELANIICDHACMLCPLGTCEGRMEIGRDACYKRWLDWLKQEADNG